MKRPEHKARKNADHVAEDIAEEYDFSQAVRGATAGRYAAGSNVVVLDPDVAAAFPDASTVNQALRLLARVARSTAPAGRSRQKRRSSRKR